ncbi:MAG: hypothetical protein CMJ68_09460 [Planctomycetaceae bacterium]|nr:hypothetical protein [Planctomycetaceae bacterium]
MGADIEEGPWNIAFVENNHVGPSHEGAAEIITRFPQLILAADEKPLVLEDRVLFQIQKFVRGVPGSRRGGSVLDRIVCPETSNFFRWIDVVFH